jgi:hypothetical protein
VDGAGAKPARANATLLLLLLLLLVMVVGGEAVRCCCFCRCFCCFCCRFLAPMMTTIGGPLVVLPLAMRSIDRSTDRDPTNATDAGMKPPPQPGNVPSRRCIMR